MLRHGGGFTMQLGVGGYGWQSLEEASSPPRAPPSFRLPAFSPQETPAGPPARWDSPPTLRAAQPSPVPGGSPGVAGRYQLPRPLAPAGAGACC